MKDAFSASQVHRFYTSKTQVICEANDFCGNLTVNLKRRNKLIKMADRSVLGWDTVAEYEADSITKIRQAENRALTKRKSNYPSRSQSETIRPAVSHRW